MLGGVDQGFVDIRAMALNAAISGLILAVPEACLATRMTLPIDAGLTTARYQAASAVGGQCPLSRGKADMSLDQSLVSE
jgi:hypothetical protein